MFIEELPQEYVNVLITYSCDVYVRDEYYGHNEFRTVTRLAFYSKSKGYYDSLGKWIETPQGYFSVPKMFRCQAINYMKNDYSLKDFILFKNSLQEALKLIKNP